jgi:type IV secretory pathway VirD2 relaxase
MIEANANKVLDSFKKREKYSFKYYRIKEAKVNSFFEEVLDKIYRKIYVMNEQNTILRTDYIVNLIYSEIINMTKEIGDKKDNDGERTSVKNRILFSKTSNLNEIKISENSEGGRKKLSMRFGSLNEENKSRNNYFNRIVKTNDSNTS